MRVDDSEGSGSGVPVGPASPLVALADAIGAVQRGLDSKSRLLNRVLSALIVITLVALVVVAVGVPVIITQNSAVRSAQRSGHTSLTLIQKEQQDTQALLKIVSDVVDPNSAIGKASAASTLAIIKQVLICDKNAIDVDTGHAQPLAACVQLQSPSSP